MFKSQMKFQKILCLVCLILAALTFVYALGFITPFYSLLSFTIDNDDYEEEKVEGVGFYWELQTTATDEEVDVYDSNNNWVGKETVTTKHTGFIDQFIIVALIDILVAVLLYVTNCHNRRKYYLGNFVATGIFAAYNVGTAIWVISRLAYFQGKYNAINFEQLEQFCEQWAKKYTPNTPRVIIYLGYVLCVVLVLAAVAVVLNLLWKLQLEKRENKLLQQNQAEEVAVNG